MALFAQQTTLFDDTTESARVSHDRSDKIAAAMAQLEAGIRDLATTPAWTAWLQAQARFHNYSFNNTLLIEMQRPGATRVAGFSTWKKLGRWVRKGEKGITILAPITYRARRDEECSYDDGETEGSGARVVLGFKTVTVFDISQTDGKDLPDSPVTRLEGSGPVAGLMHLEQMVANLGFELRDAELLGKASGVTNFTEKTVTLSSAVSNAQSFKTLAHELAHILLHSPEAGVMRSYADCRGELELEAESVAYIVCQAWGVDSSDYSLGYIVTWANGDDNAVTQLRERAERIRGAAQRILEGAAPAQLAA